MRYRLMAHCRTPYHLACPRVCPDPVENSIVTIGVEDDTASRMAGGSWRADLWKIRAPSAEEMEDTATVQRRGAPFGIMERAVTFRGGTHHDKYIASTLGNESGVGPLQAAELAISSYQHRAARTKQEETVDGGSGETTDQDLGLTVCCLSSKGFVTTHVSCAMELCRMGIVMWNFSLKFHE